MVRRLLQIGAVLLLVLLGIFVVGAFKKAHAAPTIAVSDPWRVLGEAWVKLKEPPKKNIRDRAESAARLLERGEGWEVQARKEFAAVAEDAEAVIKMLNPLIEKQNPPYSPPVLARAHHLRFDALLMKFVATLRIVKSGGTVEGREDRELLQDLNDVIDEAVKAIDFYARPESIRRFGESWVRELVIPDIQKDLPVLQQAQSQQQKRPQGTQKTDENNEKTLMKMVLGEKLGQPKAKNVQVVPVPGKGKKGGEEYSPGDKKLR